MHNFRTRRDYNTRYNRESTFDRTLQERYPSVYYEGGERSIRQYEDKADYVSLKSLLTYIS